jgi:hypothetical protein
MSQNPVVSPEFFNLSGPASIRQFFFPKQRLHITDVAPFIGICRARLYKRVKDGKLNLRIQHDESGLPFITLDDLVEYLYPSDPSLVPTPPPVHKNNFKKAGPGRPRKSVTNNGGGVR